MHTHVRVQCCAGVSGLGGLGRVRRRDSEEQRSPEAAVPRLTVWRLAALEPIVRVSFCCLRAQLGVYGIQTVHIVYIAGFVTMRWPLRERRLRRWDERLCTDVLDCTKDVVHNAP